MFKTNSESITPVSTGDDNAGAVSDRETLAHKKTAGGTELANGFQSLLDVVCFSHLRWDFVYQRPQHLLSRFAKQVRVFFVEEPLFTDSQEPCLQVAERERNVRPFCRQAYLCGASVSTPSSTDQTGTIFHHGTGRDSGTQKRNPANCRSVCCISPMPTPCWMPSN